MAFNNIPPNGFPQIPDIEDLEAVVKYVATLKAAKAAKTDIAPEFSATNNYAVGDMVYHEGTLYVCSTAHAAAAWDAQDFTAASVASEVSGLVSDVSDLNGTKANQITIAPFFNPEASYEVGDLVYYNGLSYRCTNDHEGAWDADDFAATTIAGELSRLNSKLTSGVVDTSSVQDVRFLKIGRIVTMVTEVWHQGFTVPEGFRPWATTYLATRVSTGGGTGATIGYIRVGTDGALTIPDFADFVGTVSWATA